MQNKIGRETEKQYLQLFENQKGWATLIPPSVFGQPIDTIGVFNGNVIFADVKHCAVDRFNYNNIPQNQRYAMMSIHKNAKQQPNIKVGFAIYFDRLGKFMWLKYEHFALCKGASIKYNDKRLVVFESDVML